MTYSTCLRLRSMENHQFGHIVCLFHLLVCPSFPLLSHLTGTAMYHSNSISEGDLYLVWLGNLTHLAVTQDFSAPHQREVSMNLSHMVKFKGFTNDQKSIQVTHSYTSYTSLLTSPQNSGFKTSCLLSKLHLPMTRTDSSRCRAANQENRTHISFQLGDHHLPTSFADKNQ